MSEELWDQSYAHTKRINQLEKENTQLATRIEQLESALSDMGVNTLASIGVLGARSIDTIKRIERLEAIIISMGAGNESSPPDDGNGHTHWSYPTNGASDLVDEIKGEREGEYRSAPLGISKEVNRCPRCGARMPEDDTLCVECESDLAEEQATLGQADFGGLMEPDIDSPFDAWP